MCTQNESLDVTCTPSPSSELTFWYFNEHLDKGNLKKIISWLVTYYGGLRTNGILERLKRLGFEQGLQAGVSIGVGDIAPPPMRDNFVSSIGYGLLGTNRQYNAGQMTAAEKAQRAIDSWFSATELLRRSIVLYFEQFNRMSPMHMMAFSGARGNMTQVRQLMGMRGLMLDPLGQIITSPVRASFRQGLTVTEYLISAYGARKGLVDTALRTANAGYLTRRLIDVLQDVIVLQVDCGPLGREGCFLSSLRNENGKEDAKFKRHLNYHLQDEAELTWEHALDVASRYETAGNSDTDEGKVIQRESSSESSNESIEELGAVAAKVKTKSKCKDKLSAITDLIYQNQARIINLEAAQERISANQEAFNAMLEEISIKLDYILAENDASSQQDPAPQWQPPTLEE